MPALLKFYWKKLDAQKIQHAGAEILSGMNDGHGGSIHDYAFDQRWTTVPFSWLSLVQQWSGMEFLLQEHVGC